MAKEIKGNLFNQAEESYKTEETNEADVLHARVDALKKRRSAIRETKEDRTKRVTMLLRKDLADRVDYLTSKQPVKHGFKTEFYNEAIELLLDAYEGNL